MKKTTAFLWLALQVVLALPALAANCDKPASLTGSSQWQGWGNGVANSRYSPDGLASKDLASLRLRWAFAFPDVSSVVGNPVVHGAVVYIGVDNGEVYALDLESACVYWTYKAAAGVRTAPALATINNKSLLYFGDRNANTYALDAITGKELWHSKVDTHPAAILTGSPQYVALPDMPHPYRLIVPVSSTEEGLAAVPTYQCCSFRGSVVSLDALTGEKLWQSYTIQTTARPTGANTQGPSGAAIWSAPTIDLAGKRIFVTTGDAYSSPADIATDAVLGMDLVDGHLLWINQGTADDVWTVVCLAPNAPKYCGPDQDYGSPAMLVSSDTTHYLVAGQKSGWIRAFSLAGGTQLWHTSVVENTAEFGGKVVWGGANDGRNAYFGLGSGGVVAVRLSDGEKLWFSNMLPDKSQVKHQGQDGPLTVSGDLIFSGGWDGVLRALASKDGTVLWQLNTVQDFKTVNGVPGKGGSLGAAGPVVAGKHLLVPSGYVGVKNGLPGNVLMMLAP